MKNYSISRRIILLVLLSELVLTSALAAVAVWYVRHQAQKSFAIMLRGRADSVFGAVGDAEDKEDSLLLDTSSLHLPDLDVYDVLEDRGNRLGRTPRWNGPPSDLKLEKDGQFVLRIDNHSYRGVVIHGIRSIDATAPGKGFQHPVTVYYAAPTKPIQEAMWQSIRFFGIVDLLLLSVTAAILVWLLRRASQPLRMLAIAAASVNAQSLRFTVPIEAYRVEELAPLAAALESAMHAIERAFLQQKDFLSDAAHELKTAVTLVKSSLQLLGSRERSKLEYAEGLELCLADCARMEELVLKMLTLARLERRDPQGAEQARTRIADSIEDVVAQMESFAALKQVQMKVSASESLVVHLPQEDAECLMKNLILNAVQHSMPSGVITIEASGGENGSVLVSIADEGEGILPEHLPRIFDRFYRGDASRSRHTGGTGLGLAICKAIVEAYHGSIRIGNRSPKGAVVTLELPKATALVSGRKAAVLGG